MITERAMLAAVHISIWTAVKHDRKVSRDVANQHGAHESAGRYNKQLLRGAEKLDALRTIAGQIRQHFYKITLPWSDEGYRRHRTNAFLQTALSDLLRPILTSWPAAVSTEQLRQSTDIMRPLGLFLDLNVTMPCLKPRAHKSLDDRAI
jgi:hypothetical protein